MLGAAGISSFEKLESMSSFEIERVAAKSAPWGENIKRQLRNIPKLSVQLIREPSPSLRISFLSGDFGIVAKQSQLPYLLVGNRQGKLLLCKRPRLVTREHTDIELPQVAVASGVLRVSLLLANFGIVVEPVVLINRGN